MSFRKEVKLAECRLTVGFLLHPSGLCCGIAFSVEDSRFAMQPTSRAAPTAFNTVL